MSAARLHLAWWIAAASLLLAATVAVAADDDAAARARIAAERAAAEAQYREQVRACDSRFVVTSCVDAARAQRYATLAELDRRQEALDEARRRQRADERMRSIEDKASGEEARKREEDAAARAARRPAATTPQPAASAAGGASAPAPRADRRPPVDAGARAEQEARARRAYELKQLQAEAHRQEVERRNQERVRKAGSAAPLATPAASEVGASAPSRLP